MKGSNHMLRKFLAILAVAGVALAVPAMTASASPRTCIPRNVSVTVSDKGSLTTNGVVTLGERLTFDHVTYTVTRVSPLAITPRLPVHDWDQPLNFQVAGSCSRV